MSVEVQHIVRHPGDTREMGEDTVALCGETFPGRENNLEDPFCPKCAKISIDGLHFTNSVLRQVVQTMATLHDAVSVTMASEESGKDLVKELSDGDPVKIVAEKLQQGANIAAGRVSLTDAIIKDTIEKVFRDAGFGKD